MAGGPDPWAAPQLAARGLRLEPILTVQIWKSKSKRSYLDNHDLPTHQTTTNSIPALLLRARTAFRAVVALGSSSSSIAPNHTHPFWNRKARGRDLDNYTFPTPQTTTSAIYILSRQSDNACRASISLSSSPPAITMTPSPSKSELPSHHNPHSHNGSRISGAMHGARADIGKQTRGRIAPSFPLFSSDNDLLPPTVSRSLSTSIRRPNACITTSQGRHRPNTSKRGVSSPLAPLEPAPSSLTTQTPHLSLLTSVRGPNTCVAIPGGLNRPNTSK